MPRARGQSSRTGEAAGVTAQGIRCKPDVNREPPRVVVEGGPFRLGAYDSLATISRYIDAFVVRTDAFAAYNCDADGWRPVRCDLTPDRVRAGLLGWGPPLATYLPRPDGLTGVMALDFDRDDGIRQALRVGRLLRQHGIVAYIEPSRRGAHLWVPLAHLVEATTAIRALRGALRVLGLDGDPKVELRPLLGRLSSPERLGHSIRLPLMPHPRTRLHGWLYDPTECRRIGESLADLLDHLVLTPGAAVLSFAARFGPPLTPTRRPPSARERLAASGSVVAVLRDVWGVPDPSPGQTVRCPAHADSHPSLSIATDDGRVWCHAPECVLFNDGRGRGPGELMRLATRSA